MITRNVANSYFLCDEEILLNFVSIKYLQNWSLIILLCNGSQKILICFSPRQVRMTIAWTRGNTRWISGRNWSIRRWWSTRQATIPRRSLSRQRALGAGRYRGAAAHPRSPSRRGSIQIVWHIAWTLPERRSERGRENRRMKGMERTKKGKRINRRPRTYSPLLREGKKRKWEKHGKGRSLLYRVS